MPKRWEQEEIDWLSNFAPGHFSSEIAEAMSAKFGKLFTQDQIHNALARYHIHNNMIHKGYLHVKRLTTPEQDRLVRERFHDTAVGGYIAVQEYLHELGVELTLSQVKGYLSRKKIRLGVYGRFKKGHVPENKGKRMSLENFEKCRPTMFKKGHRPVNYDPVGTKKIKDDGYEWTKIAEPNIWKQSHRVLWEKLVGAVPEGYLIIFLNGDRSDIRLDNLAIVSKAEHARLNNLKLRHENAEITKIGITIAKLASKVSELKKRGGKRNGV